MDVSQWEHQIEQQLAEIRRQGGHLAKSAAAARGQGEIRGISMEVDITGEITNLQIALATMRWTNTQLTTALLDCHRRARGDAKKKLDQLMQRTDRRLRDQYIQTRRPAASADKSPARQLTEEEIQAADDTYFERRNLYGGWGDTQPNR